MSNDKITDGMMVSLRYCIKNQRSDIIEDILALPPVSYLHGSAGIHESLQKAVTGMRPGDNHNIILKATEITELQEDIDIQVIVDAVREASLEEMQKGNQAFKTGNLFCGDECSCHTGVTGGKDHV